VTWPFAFRTTSRRFNAHRNLTATSGAAAKAMEKLASGYRINRASDDAAGLAISEKMRAQITGLAQAQRNAQDGISLVQTAEGALTEVHSMLNRVRELKVQFSNGTLNTEDKSAINKEITALTAEISDISVQTKFNDKSLFGRPTFEFVVGAAGTEKITTDAVSLASAAALNSASTIASIDEAIKLSPSRAPVSVRSRTASSTV
jgi:flagellin